MSPTCHNNNAWPICHQSFSWSVVSTFWDMNFYPVTDRKRRIWAHRAICTGGLKTVSNYIMVEGINQVFSVPIKYHLFYPTKNQGSSTSLSHKSLGVCISNEIEPPVYLSTLCWVLVILAAWSAARWSIHITTFKSGFPEKKKECINCFEGGTQYVIRLSSLICQREVIEMTFCS